MNLGKVYNIPSTGEIVVEGSAGEKRWSSTFPPVNLLPQANWIEQSLSVAFPDFTKFVNYSHCRWFSPPAPTPGGEWRPSQSADVCTSVTMIEPEETVTAPITIATVPAGVNYIDVRVRLNRTKVPHIFREQPVPVIIPNEWVHLPGGSCIVEATEIWRRSFDIVLSGQNINLVRRQSVAPAPLADGSGEAIYFNRGYTGLSSDGQNPWGQSTYQRWGWTENGGSDWRSGTRRGHPAALIEAKEADPNFGADTPAYGAKHIRRSRACSTDNSAHDFSSIYSGQIVIRPGFMAI